LQIKKKGKIFSLAAQSQNFSSDLSLSRARALLRGNSDQETKLSQRAKNTIFARLRPFSFIASAESMKVLIAQRERERIVLHFIFPYRIKCWIRKKVISGGRSLARARARDRIGSDHEKKTKERDTYLNLGGLEAGDGRDLLSSSKHCCLY